MKEIEIEQSYVTRKMMTYALIESACLMVGVSLLVGLIDVPQGKLLGIALIVGAGLWLGLMVLKLLTRYTCDSCGTVLSGALQKGVTCDRCQVIYKLQCNAS